MCAQCTGERHRPVLWSTVRPVAALFPFLNEEKLPPTAYKNRKTFLKTTKKNTLNIIECRLLRLYLSSQMWENTYKKKPGAPSLSTMPGISLFFSPSVPAVISEAASSVGFCRKRKRRSGVRPPFSPAGGGALLHRRV